MTQVSELASALRSSREEVAAQVAAAIAKDRENSQLWEQVCMPPCTFLMDTKEKRQLLFFLTAHDAKTANVAEDQLSQEVLSAEPCV